NPSWQSAATLDGARPKDPEPCRAVGDAWWQLAEGETGRTRVALRRRASEWYDKGLAGLTGLPQTQLVQKIKPYRGPPDLSKIKPALDLNLREPAAAPIKAKHTNV